MNFTIPDMIEKSFSAYPDNPALSFFEGEVYTYRDIQNRIEDLAASLVSRGILPGDRVALYSGNQPNWGVVYLAAVRIGAVIVPILPDFTSEEMMSILDHSQSKILFHSQLMNEKVKNSSLEKLVLESLFPLKKSPGKADFEKASEYRSDIREDTLAALIYTSGTTGKSKGVMLSHGNLAYNVDAGSTVFKMKPHHVLLSVLPLAHTYECTVGFLYPLASGSHVVYFGKPPVPAMLTAALASVKPHIMLAVPLLIEKIYRGKIASTFNKNFLMKALYATPPFRQLLSRVAGKKLMSSFGGRLEFFGVGGAPLAEEVERFLRRAKFPYAIGYGLTETSPLIAGGAPHEFPVRSTGPIVPYLETRLLPDGELQVKGSTVMQGYFGEEELTAEVLSKEGWFSTGDLCSFDKKGNLFIKGRKKNVIIGSNGENIYPETLESLINEQPFVQESLVTQQKGKLVAMIHLNYEAIMEELKTKGEEASSQILDYLNMILKQVNHKVGAFSRISEVMEQKTPFVRTPTKKIKRFLYVG